MANSHLALIYFVAILFYYYGLLPYIWSYIVYLLRFLITLLYSPSYLKSLLFG